MAFKCEVYCIDNFHLLAGKYKIAANLFILTHITRDAHRNFSDKCEDNE